MENKKMEIIFTENPLVISKLKLDVNNIVVTDKYNKRVSIVSSSSVRNSISLNLKGIKKGTKLYIRKSSIDFPISNASTRYIDKLNSLFSVYKDDLKFSYFGMNGSDQLGVRFMIAGKEHRFIKSRVCYFSTKVTKGEILFSSAYTLDNKSSLVIPSASKYIYVLVLDKYIDKLRLYNGNFLKRSGLVHIDNTNLIFVEFEYDSSTGQSICVCKES